MNRKKGEKTKNKKTDGSTKSTYIQLLTMNHDTKLLPSVIVAISPNLSYSVVSTQ